MFNTCLLCFGNFCSLTPAEGVVFASCGVYVGALFNLLFFDSELNESSLLSSLLVIDLDLIFNVNNFGILYDRSLELFTL